MDGQTHAVGKAIRPLFADPVTIAVPIFYDYGIIGTLTDISFNICDIKM